MLLSKISETREEQVEEINSYDEEEEIKSSEVICKQIDNFEI